MRIFLQKVQVKILEKWDQRNFKWKTWNQKSILVEAQSSGRSVRSSLFGSDVFCISERSSLGNFSELQQRGPQLKICCPTSKSPKLATISQVKVHEVCVF